MCLELEDVLGDAVFVRLSQRKGQPAQYTLIDREDFERVTRSNWFLDKGYARATSNRYLARHHMKLSAYILKAQPGEIVDHISGDTLDNRKQNLRIVTRSENAKNMKRPTFPGKTSRFKGVCWDKSAGKWLAQIRSDHVQRRLGLFDHEVEAALAYDEAALRVHGEFARTNAAMKLFEMEDPFVPDCSAGAISGPRRHRNRHPMMPKHAFSNRCQKQSYDEKLTAEAKELIERVS